MEGEIFPPNIPAEEIIPELEDLEFHEGYVSLANGAQLLLLGDGTAQGDDGFMYVQVWRGTGGPNEDGIFDVFESLGWYKVR